MSFYCFSTGWLKLFFFFLKVFSCEEIGKNSQWCRLEVDLNNSSVWPCSCSSLCDNERDPLGPQYLPVSDSHNTRQTDNLHTEAGLWLFLQFYIFCTLLNIYPRQLLENDQLWPLPALAPAPGIRKKVTIVASCSERVLFRFFPSFCRKPGVWCSRFDVGVGFDC